jgi:predicted TPR repeat methyltransferase
MFINNLAMSTAHRLLANEFVYDSYQACVGSVDYRKSLVRKLAQQEIVSYLDIGCGTASTIDLLPHESEYFGVDISEKYLERARKRKLGINLVLGDVSKGNWIKAINLKKPSTCMALGIFHHLNDYELDSMLNSCLQILPNGSQIFSMDPIINDSTSRGAKWFAENDRGKYVRSAEQLESIFHGKGLKPIITIKRKQMRIPLDTVEISIKI